MKRLLALSVLAFILLPIGVQPSAAQSPNCVATRVIFYSSSDWQRLADGLAANPSSCAQYYISVDPLTANKTVERPGAASIIDALGSNFHAVAEINWDAWSSWVAQTGNTWLAAGQAARAAMDTAGFSVANGDTWDINEFPSTVRTDTGGARQDAEQFVQGLYQGGSGDAPAQGIVFMIGVGQTQTSLATYKASLESWFQDATFWNTMSTDVSDFMFETYGDVRSYAVAGESPLTRANYLSQFMEAPLELVSAADTPATAYAARQYLQASYGALANASWAWTDDYGWTEVPDTTMEDYIDAQTYAMRLSNAARIGFAWNPLNTEGLDTTDFNTEVQAVLGAVATSIQATDGGDPTQACAATGCSAVIGGTAPATGWSIFDDWSPTEATFATNPQTTAPGTSSDAFLLNIETDGVAATLPFASTLELSSNTSGEEFATTASGPWSPSLTMSLPAGTASATFFTEASSPGSPVITASLNGNLTTQTETVTGSTVAAPPPPPPSAAVTSLTFAPTNDRMHVSLRVLGATGTPLQARVALSLRVGDATVASMVARTTAAGWLGMTAYPQLERGCYRVDVTAVAVAGYAWNKASPTATDCVSALPLQISKLVLGRRDGHVHLALRVINAASRPVDAHVRLALREGSTTVATATATTAADGWLDLTAGAKLTAGCYRVEVSAVRAAGYAWNTVVPSTSYCVSQSSLPHPRRHRAHRGV